MRGTVGKNMTKRACCLGISLQDKHDSWSGHTRPVQPGLVGNLTLNFSRAFGLIPPAGCVLQVSHE